MNGAAGPLVVALVSIGIAACASEPIRSPAERAADGETAAQVEVALENDPRIYARHIDVRVDRGTVHLGGFVWSSEELLFAKADAAAIPGVTGVANEMDLMRGGVSGTSR
jgi:osmotically-inducible protein OsmY